MSSEHAMCAHLKVEYKPVEHDNGTNSDRWVCSLCGGDFWPQHWLFPAPWLAAETAERTPPPDLEQKARQLALLTIGESGAKLEQVIADWLTRQSPAERSGDGQAWKCKARTANMGANDPQDCDWPVCGCDPYADKVIEALQESGKLK